MKINENISEINQKANDEGTTTLGVLSLLNEKQDSSPTRLPAHQLLDETTPKGANLDL